MTSLRLFLQLKFLLACFFRVFESICIYFWVTSLLFFCRKWWCQILLHYLCWGLFTKILSVPYQTKNSKNDVISDVIMTSELIRVDSTLQCNTKLKFMTSIKIKCYWHGMMIKITQNRLGTSDETGNDVISRHLRDPKISENVRYKILFKVRRFQIQTFSRLAFILKKPVGGANLPLPAQNRVNNLTSFR